MVEMKTSEVGYIMPKYFEYEIYDNDSE